MVGSSNTQKPRARYASGMEEESAGEETVSVVITNFNKGAALLRAMASVKEQNELPKELILVDDCSTDPTSVEILKKLSAPDCNFRLLRTPRNLGAAGAKNFGIKNATGTLIMLLDSDDELPSQAVSQVRNFFGKHRQTAVVFGDALWVDGSPPEQTIRSGANIASPDGGLNIRKLAKNWQLLGTSPFRRSVFTSVGGFDTSHPRTDDVDFFRRVLVAGFEAKYLGKTIYVYHRNLSDNNQRIDAVDLSLSWFRNMDFYLKALTPIEFIFMFLTKTTTFFSRLAKKQLGKGRVRSLTPIKEKPENP